MALIDAGGNGFYDVASGRWSVDLYRSGQTQVSTISQSVTSAGISNPPPLSVLQSYAQDSDTAVGAKMQYSIPLPDGNYQIRLFFVEPTGFGAGNRRFDVTLQGQTVLNNFDIAASAGADFKAVERVFSFTASQGIGLDLGLINRFNAAVISAFEITRVDATAPASFAVNLEFSPDSGQSWSTIATNLTSNRFGEGQFLWNANQTTQGHTGLFRATAVALV